MDRLAENPYGKHGKWARWRVVQLHIDHGWAPAAVHQHINSGGDEDMSLRTVYNIIEGFYLTADVKTEHSGQRVVIGSIPADCWEYIRSLIHEDPSLFLDEIGGLVFSGFNVRIPTSTLCQNLLNANYTMRSLKQLAIRRCLEDEENWGEMIKNLDASRVKFMDFMHQNPHKMARKHGRGQRGQRTYHNVDFGYGKRYSVLALIGLKGKGLFDREGGILGYGISTGNADADMTCAMVYHKVLPHISVGDILVADNASYFKDLRLRAMIEASGARYMFLNPYAKHENPIEESFSKKNAFLVRNRELALRDPHRALALALESITSADAAGYYRHAGLNVKSIEVIPGVLTLYE